MLKRITNGVAKWVLTDDKPGLFDISNIGPIYIQDNTWLPVCLQMSYCISGLAISKHCVDYIYMFSSIALISYNLLLNLTFKCSWLGDQYASMYANDYPVHHCM